MNNDARNGKKQLFATVLSINWQPCDTVTSSPNRAVVNYRAGANGTAFAYRRRTADNRRRGQ